MLPKALSVLFILFLVLGVPVLSLSTARDSQVRQMPRLSLYISAAISQWVLAGLGLLIFFLSSLSVFSVGFRTLAPVATLTWAGALVALSVAGIRLGLFLELRGWWPPEAELVYLLIPKTRQEKFWSVLLLAPTAALARNSCIAACSSLNLLNGCLRAHGRGLLHRWRSGWRTFIKVGTEW